jgi:hypothetical protein
MDMEPTTGLQGVVYLLMLFVLLGLYKGDKGWGRTVLWLSLFALAVMLFMNGPEIFADLLDLLLPQRRTS